MTTEYVVQQSTVPDVWETVVMGTPARPMERDAAESIVRAFRRDMLDGNWRVGERPAPGPFQSREEVAALHRQPDTFGPAWADRSQDPTAS
jgi:hypothetical protein